MLTQLQTIDWAIIIGYLVFAIVLGLYFSKRSGKSVESFFVGDKNLPWWLAGTSIVATTFAADTPLAVTGLVASGGISGNWVWWSWGIAHVSATFFFAKLWRRSGVITDAEITELRYSGGIARKLRVFKAFYFGIFINCLTMAWVIAAMVKISAAFFETSPVWVITGCVGFSVLYTSLGGFRSVVFTDVLQFGLGMVGAIALMWYALDAYGGLGKPPTETEAGSGLLQYLGEASDIAGYELSAVIDFIPSSDHPLTPLAYFIVLLIAGWWRYAEGNGYIVQRLAATKNEAHAQGASLWFAVAHNALRPWPWIIVGLVALVVYPKLPAMEKGQPAQLERAGFKITPNHLDLHNGGTLTIEGAEAGAIIRVAGEEKKTVVDGDGDGDGKKIIVMLDGPQTTSIQNISIQTDSTMATIPGLRVELQDREMAYPLLMAKYLPTGLLGLVIASLLAAFMSTIDTHTNWGASYLIRDVYQPYVNPGKEEKHYVWVSRAAILLMAILAGFSATFVTSIGDVWKFLVTLGAGLGSVTAARWYWHRVTAHAEFAALLVTTVVALTLQILFSPKLFGAPNNLMISPIEAWVQILMVAGSSLATWIPVALWGPQEDRSHLEAFAEKVRPPGPGWKGFIKTDSQDPIKKDVIRFFAGLYIVYGTLFGIGYMVMGDMLLGSALCVIAAIMLGFVVRSSKMDTDLNAVTHSEPAQ